jgi:hypothetical protein
MVKVEAGPYFACEKNRDCDCDRVRGTSCLGQSLAAASDISLGGVSAGFEQKT